MDRNKWTRLIATALLTTVCALSVPQQQMIVQAQETQNVKGGESTQDEHKRLKSFRSDFQQVKKIDRQIRALTHRLREDSRELRQVVHRAGDKKLKEQVKQDLKTFHAKLGEAHKLHRADTELKKQIHAARLNGDLGQLRELAHQRLNNKRNQLTRLEEAHNALKVELDNVKKQLKLPSAGRSSTR